MKTYEIRRDGVLLGTVKGRNMLEVIYAAHDKFGGTGLTYKCMN